MRVRSLLGTVSAGAVAIGLLVAPVGAAPALTASATALGSGRAAVTGTAAFTPITEPQSVGGSVTRGTVATTPVAEPAGLLLTGAKILPLDDGSGLRFMWEVSQMPAQVPPEGVRYNWSFKIGERSYQLQAKRTNLASVTTAEDPVGHVQHAQKQENFFQLRGNCTTSYLGTPISGCYHLAFLKGSFDVANKRISVDLPFETKDGIGRLVAPDFKPGVTLMPVLTANTSIVAGAQAVISTADTGSSINDWTPYFVGSQVQLGVGAPNVDPAEAEYTSAATVAGDGTFSGTVSGLDRNNTHVFVRACNGTECAYASVLPAAA